MSSPPATWDLLDGQAIYGLELPEQPNDHLNLGPSRWTAKLLPMSWHDVHISRTLV